jgi:hypothetical protein
VRAAERRRLAGVEEEGKGRCGQRRREEEARDGGDGVRGEAAEGRGRAERGVEAAALEERDKQLRHEAGRGWRRRRWRRERGGHRLGVGFWSGQRRLITNMVNQDSVKLLILLTFRLLQSQQESEQSLGETPRSIWCWHEPHKESLGETPRSTCIVGSPTQFFFFG